MNQLASRFGTISRCENKLCLASLCKCVILAPILVTVSVSTNNDGLGPAGNKTRDIADYDWLTENSAIQNVSDCAVW